MSASIPVVSPIDGAIWHVQSATTPQAIESSLVRGQAALRSWKMVPVEDKISLIERFVCAMESKISDYSEALCHQMGRPISQCPGEIRGLAERARAMNSLALRSLSDIEPEPQDGFKRFIRREPLGLVLVLAPHAPKKPASLRPLKPRKPLREKCPREVSERSVGEKCRGEVSEISVFQK